MLEMSLNQDDARHRPSRVLYNNGIKITRRKHSKSKVGCPQCRARKVKCDESLPACTKCLNRNVKCGYLDYSPRQIELVKLAKWEANGSNPNTIPIKAQEIIPQRGIEIDFSDKSNTNTNLKNYHKSQYSTSETDYSNSPSPLSHNESNQRQHHHFKLPMVRHVDKRPEFDLKQYPSSFNETLATFSARLFIKNLLIERMIMPAFTNDIAFSGSLLFGYGAFLRKYLEFEPTFLIHRGYCIEYLLKTIKDLNDDNAKTLLNTSVALDLTTVFLKDRIDYKQHFKFSIGPLSLLRVVYESPEQFPKSFKTFKAHADAILYTTKYVWVPQYNTKVFDEFYNVVKEFGNKYIKNGDNQLIITQFYDMIKILEFCLDLFKNYKSNDLVVRYPIDKLYELFQLWFSTFPSECFTLSAKTEKISKVFYVLWFTLLKILESVIISCRYIFSFFLDGYYLIYPFKRTSIEIGLEEDDDLRYYFNYACRIIPFFDRRMCYIMRNTRMNDPIPMFLSLKDRLKARPLEIHEKCITTFRDTLIKKIHYPVDSTNIKTDSSSELFNAYSSTDTQNDDTQNFPESLNDLIKDTKLHEDEENNKVDLIGNVNSSTSLLRNDFDPRFTDAIFETKVVIHNADIIFFDRYIEDKKLIHEL